MTCTQIHQDPDCPVFSSNGRVCPVHGGNTLMANGFTEHWGHTASGGLARWVTPPPGWVGKQRVSYWDSVMFLFGRRPNL